MAHVSRTKHVSRLKKCFASVGFSAEYDKVPLGIIALLSSRYSTAGFSVQSHYYCIYMVVTLHYTMAAKLGEKKNISESWRHEISVNSMRQASNIYDTKPGT